LEEAVKKIVTDRNPSSPLMFCEKERFDTANAFVVCVSSENPREATRIRTYRRADTAVRDMAIWEAARATTAASIFFRPYRTQLGGKEVDLHDGAFGPDRQIGSVISIGTGTKKVTLPDQHKSQLRYVLKVVGTAKNVMTDPERVHQRVQQRFASCLGVYSRLNLHGGVEEVGLNDYKKMGELKAMTKAYIKTTAGTAIEGIVNRLLRRDLARLPTFGAMCRWIDEPPQLAPFNDGASLIPLV
jgi:hypothetical protein